MRSTGSGTTFTQRQTSMTFQVLIFLQSPLSKTDNFATATKFPSYRESKERQGPTLGVRLIDVSFKREWTVNKDQV